MTKSSGCICLKSRILTKKARQQKKTSIEKQKLKVNSCFALQKEMRLKPEKTLLLFTSYRDNSKEHDQRSNADSGEK